MSRSTAASNGTTVHPPGDTTVHTTVDDNSVKPKRQERNFSATTNSTWNTPTNHNEEVSGYYITKQIINTTHYFTPNQGSSVSNDTAGMGSMIVVPFPAEAGLFATTSSQELEARTAASYPQSISGSFSRVEA